MRRRPVQLRAVSRPSGLRAHPVRVRRALRRTAVSGITSADVWRHRLRPGGGCVLR